jgi:putative component of toxin-antitoxin plasmid stabilization module
MEYNLDVIEIRKSDAFDRWFMGLRDRGAVARIKSRIDRLRSVFWAM